MTGHRILPNCGVAATVVATLLAAPGARAQPTAGQAPAITAKRPVPSAETRAMEARRVEAEAARARLSDPDARLEQQREVDERMRVRDSRMNQVMRSICSRC